MAGSVCDRTGMGGWVRCQNRLSMAERVATACTHCDTGTL